MYKVFFNGKKIIIAPEGNITFNNKNHFFDKKRTIEEIKKWFFSFIESDLDDIIILHKKPKKVFKLIKSGFLVVKAAGGIVRRNNKILFIYRNNKWDLPKGKIDKGETKKQAAVREVQEECGLDSLEISKSLDITYHIFQSPFKETFGEWVLKETYWYEMKHWGNDLGNPQTEEGITRLRWLNKIELAKVIDNTYDNLQELIKPYLD